MDAGKKIKDDARASRQSLFKQYLESEASETLAKRLIAAGGRACGYTIALTLVMYAPFSNFLWPSRHASIYPVVFALVMTDKLRILGLDPHSLTTDGIKQKICDMSQLEIGGLIRTLRLANKAVLQADANERKTGQINKYPTVSRKAMQQRIDDPNDDAQRPCCIYCNNPKSWHADERTPAGGYWLGCDDQACKINVQEVDAEYEYDDKDEISEQPCPKCGLTRGYRVISFTSSVDSADYKAITDSIEHVQCKNRDCRARCMIFDGIVRAKSTITREGNVCYGKTENVEKFKGETRLDLTGA
jgi:hypothetical protein